MAVRTGTKIQNMRREASSMFISWSNDADTWFVFWEKDGYGFHGHAHNLDDALDMAREEGERHERMRSDLM